MVDGRVRNLAMFNLAIDSKLRGWDVVALKVEDVAPNGYPVERATVPQRKTAQPVKFELTEQTRRAQRSFRRHPGLEPAADAQDWRSRPRCRLAWRNNTVHSTHR